MSDDPVTERQRDFIIKLGGNPEHAVCKEEASLYIEDLLLKAEKVTPRQLMVLQFWGRQELFGLKKPEVTEWITEFYEVDYRRLNAWERFKDANPIFAVGQIAGRWKQIEEGIGYTWLRKGAGKTKKPREKKKVGCVGMAFALFIGFVIFTFVRGVVTEALR